MAGEAVAMVAAPACRRHAPELRAAVVKRGVSRALVDTRGARELAAALAPELGAARFNEELYLEDFNEHGHVLHDLDAWLEQARGSPATRRPAMRPRGRAARRPQPGGASRQ